MMDENDQVRAVTHSSYELNFAASGIQTRDLVIRSQECSPFGHQDASGVFIRTALSKYELLYPN